MTIDPRLAVVDRRLAGAQRILPVTGGKGGIGKSVVASLLALALAESGRRVGLLDLDLTGPCDHLILGVGRQTPAEEFGLKPPEVFGVRFMSVTHFIGDRPAPLRGTDVSNALIELLAITQWGELDFLIVDMPPGLGDAALDAARLVPRAEYLVVATPSRVVLETVRRTLRLLKQLELPVAGVVENMRREEGDAVATLARDLEVPLLGALPFDATLEAAAGDQDRLEATAFATALEPIRSALGL